jgi:hypothetical protein
VFNPRVDLQCPTGSQGSARIAAPGNVVVVVNQLQAGTAQALSYNGIRTDGTNKTALSPVALSRLTNGFSTVLTVQNLDLSSSATITFTYVPNTACVSCAQFVKVMTALPGGSVVQNNRLGDSSHPLPAGWFGAASVTSDKPIAGVVNQLDLSHGGDGSMSFNMIGQP